MWAAIAAFFVGHGLYKAGLPDSVKQQEFDRSLERRAARTASPNPTAGQWIVGILFLLIVIGLIMRGVQALIGA